MANARNSGGPHDTKTSMTSHSLEPQVKTIPTKTSTKVISHHSNSHNNNYQTQTLILCKNQALISTGPTKLLPLYEIPVVHDEIMEDGVQTCLTNAINCFDKQLSTDQ
mmetsp:Transcript_31016/g.38340  ORF Transcript_31016/g.38340 Transcript_31016/m.38340 type:complete len:108 (-) Transcript_31016:74-397(-)